MRSRAAGEAGAHTRPQDLRQQLLVAALAAKRHYPKGYATRAAKRFKSTVPVSYTVQVISDAAHALVKRHDRLPAVLLPASPPAGAVSAVLLPASPPAGAVTAVSLPASPPAGAVIPAGVPAAPTDVSVSSSQLRAQPSMSVHQCLASSLFSSVGAASAMSSPSPSSSQGSVPGHMWTCSGCGSSMHVNGSGRHKKMSMGKRR